MGPVVVELFNVRYLAVPSKTTVLTPVSFAYNLYIQLRVSEPLF